MLVVVLVGVLMYCISPGEVETAWTVVTSRVWSELSGRMRATLESASDAIDQVLAEPATPTKVGHNASDPFRPFGPRETPDASRVADWLKGPEPVAIWVCMVVALLVHRYIRRKRFKFATEQGMEIAHSKAERQT